MLPLLEEGAFLAAENMALGGSLFTRGMLSAGLFGMASGLWSKSNTQAAMYGVLAGVVAPSGSRGNFVTNVLSSTAISLVAHNVKQHYFADKIAQERMDHSYTASLGR